jgi:hypothetical protein
MTTTSITTVVDGYIAAWNTADAGDRRALIAQVFADDTTYVDPLMQGTGHDGIDALIAGAQGQYPGHRFELLGDADHHNDRVRFSWTLVGPDGPIAVGRDFATLADDGRLRDVTGFLEAPAA